MDAITSIVMNDAEKGRLEYLARESVASRENLYKLFEWMEERLTEAYRLGVDEGLRGVSDDAELPKDAL